jgi:hypothetical protein
MPVKNSCRGDQWRSSHSLPLAMPTQTDEADYSWFNREEYELQRCLASEDWALMLKIRLDFKKKYQGQLTSIFDKRERKQFWDDYCKSVSLKEYLKKKQEGVSALPSRVPPLQEVTAEMLTPSGSQLVITEMIVWQGTRALLINPWASHGLLKKEFDRWLRHLKQQFPSPFKRRGRPGANIGVTKLHLKSWANHSILAVFDLDFYSEVLSRRPLSRSALHKIIDPESPNAVEWAKRARRLVRQVIDGLEFLTVEARSSGGK